MLHKSIKGFEDYLITNTGRVYSLKSKKYLKPYKDKDGYVIVSLYKNGKSNKNKVHRLVAEAFIENSDNKPAVDHINRVRDDNRVQNLRWVTIKENNQNTNIEQRLDRLSKVRDPKKASHVAKKKNMKVVIERINEEITIGYLSINQVPNIQSSLISSHNSKSDNFVIKQRNGMERIFFIPK